MFFFAPADPAYALLDAATASHARLTRFRVHVELDAKADTNRQRVTYDLAADGGRILVRIREPRKPGEDKSDRTYFFANNRLVGFDAYANERIARDLPPVGSQLQRIQFVLGSMPDLLNHLLEPSGMKEFLDGMKHPGWRRQRKNGVDLLIRSQGLNTKPAVLGFDPKTHLLRRVDIGLTGNEVHWTFDYSAPGPVTFNPPASARPVPSFTVAPEPPKYANATVEKTTRAMLDAHARFTTGSISILDGGQVIKLAFDGRKFREEGRQLSYAYDGKVLSVLNAKFNTFYRGSAARSTIPDLLFKVGAGADSMSRQMLQGRIPFREMIRSNMKVSQGGTVASAQGIPCDILSFDGGRTKITVFVRRTDHLVDSMMTNIVDGSGRTISMSARRFVYTKSAPPAARFLLDPKPGQTAKPLPEIKIEE